MAIIPAIPIVNAGELYVNNLSLSFVSDTKISLSAGAARDSTDKNDILLNSTVVIDFETKGANGIDEGSFDILNTYAIYVIGDSTGYKQTAAIASLNAIKPIFPAGYDMFRRVGWAATGSSLAILKFAQYGTDETRSYYYDGSNIVLLGGSSVVFDPVSLSPFVPKIPTEVTFRVEYHAAATANSVSFSTFESSSIGMVTYGCGSTDFVFSSFVIPSQINSISGDSSISYAAQPGDTVTLIVSGYKDYL